LRQKKREISHPDSEEAEIPGISSLFGILDDLSGVSDGIVRGVKQMPSFSSIEGGVWGGSGIQNRTNVWIIRLPLKSPSQNRKSSQQDLQILVV